VYDIYIYIYIRLTLNLITKLWLTLDTILNSIIFSDHQELI